MVKAGGGNREVRVIAVANQKGGVGKTTTAVNLSIALAQRGLKVVLVDLDPQANATAAFGIAPKDIEYSIADVLEGNASMTMAATVRSTEVPGLGLVPGEIGLANIEAAFLEGGHAPTDRLAEVIKAFLATPEGAVDALVIDLPPSLGLLTRLALEAATRILVPIEISQYAITGLRQLASRIEHIQLRSNPRLKLMGVLFSIFDGRTVAAREVRSQFEADPYWSRYVFKTAIPVNNRVREATFALKPVVLLDKSASSSRAFGDLAEEVVERW